MAKARADRPSKLGCEIFIRDIVFAVGYLKSLFIYDKALNNQKKCSKSGQG
jgi:hypothetical protein